MTAQYITDADGNRTGIILDLDTYQLLLQAQENLEDIRAAEAAKVELQRRQRVLEEANAAYTALRDDPEAWAAEQAERALHEGTLADGLEAY